MTRAASVRPNAAFAKSSTSILVGFSSLFDVNALLLALGDSHKGHGEHDNQSILTYNR